MCFALLFTALSKPMEQGNKNGNVCVKVPSVALHNIAAQHQEATLSTH